MNMKTFTEEGSVRDYSSKFQCIQNFWETLRFLVPKRRIMSISPYFSALCQWQDDGWSRGPRLSGGVLENFMEVCFQKWDKTMKMPTFGHVVHMQAYNVHDYI